MKVLVITNGYPSEKNIYTNQFVHSRILKYYENGIDVEVYSIENSTNKYTHENIKVNTGKLSDIKSIIDFTLYDKILIHFISPQLIDFIIREKINNPIIIWLHGYESMKWSRRLAYLDSNIISILKFVRYIYNNTNNIRSLKKLTKNNHLDITYVFVSNWLLDIFKKDVSNNIKKYSVIHNYIDEDYFNYKAKSANDRLNILSIKSYKSRIYANDLVVKTILELSKETFFNNLSFSLYGDGVLFKRTVEPLLKKNFTNVKIHKGFINKEEIKELHDNNGIFLVPTRMDSQGVSRGEAQSSGLVPITTDVAAVSEFVNNDTGYLTSYDDYKQLAEAIKDLYNNPKKFIEMSSKTSEHVKNQCGYKNTIIKEIELINKIN